MSMRYALMVVAGLLPATAVRAEPTDADRKAIQGTWTVTSAEMRAEKKDDLIGSTITFDGDQVTIQVKGKDKASEGTFVLDSTAKPKQLDITRKGEEKPLRAIYELDGDTLRICMADKPIEDRPAKFETSPERKVVLLVLKRGKK